MIAQQNADGTWTEAKPIGWQEEHSPLARLILWVRGVEHCNDREGQYSPRPWHVHYDRNWVVYMGMRYDRCRCGAVRTTRWHGPRTFVMEAPGWPRTKDHRGRERRTSGWVTGLTPLDPHAAWQHLSDNFTPPPPILD